MSSISSDDNLDPENFWDEYQDAVANQSDSPLRVSIDFKRSTTINQNSPNKFLFKQLTTEPFDYFKQRMEVSIQKLRKENETQVNSVKLVVRNKTRKELKSAVDEIRAQFEKEVLTIKQDHDKMKDEISKKNKEVLIIAEYMIDQETMVTQNRLSSIFKVVEIEKSPEIIAEEKQLKKDLNVVKVQIDAMKEAIKEYTNDTIQSASKVKELDQEIAMIQNKHREELKELEIYLESRVNKAIQERDNVKEEFENYKKLGWKELEEKEEACLRQREIILLLQSELKKAKGILHNPRLKLRVHDKLKDYIDEYEDEPNESPISMINKTAGLNYKRSRIFDKRNHTSTKSNYETSGRYTSTQEPSFELPKFQVKNNNFLQVHKSKGVEKDTLI